MQKYICVSWWSHDTMYLCVNILNVQYSIIIYWWWNIFVLQWNSADCWSNQSRNMD